MPIQERSRVIKQGDGEKIHDSLSRLLLVIAGPMREVVGRDVLMSRDGMDLIWRSGRSLAHGIYRVAAGITGIGGLIIVLQEQG